MLFPFINLVKVLFRVNDRDRGDNVDLHDDGGAHDYRLNLGALKFGSAYHKHPLYRHNILSQHRGFYIPKLLCIN